MQSWEIATLSADVLEIRRTTAGRMLDGVGAFGTGGLIAAIGGAVFFGIDAVGRATAGLDAPRGYLLAVVTLGVFAGVVAFVWRVMRRRRWIFDVGAGVIALEWQRAFGTTDAVEVPLAELRNLRLDAGGVGRTSAVVAVFVDGEEAIATSRLGASEMATVHRSLTDFLAERGIALPA